ncbi:MAG: InlB B-repeat-containing protein [Ruminiclostridium sp.]|nr:InlB B-repeat-containing protein [Ruminiclostridium sp.]
MKKTRQILSVFLSVCMIISCMAGFTFTVSAADDPRIIVSLGDSYSAGEGIAPYYGSKKSDADKVKDHDWLAHRSLTSWGSQLTLDGVPMTRGENWFFAAASGAETKDIEGKQEITYKKGDYSGTATLDPQISVFNGLTLTENDFVTLTLGGNDVGFVDLMKVALYEALKKSPYSMMAPSIATQLFGDQNLLAEMSLEQYITYIQTKFSMSIGAKGKIKAAYKTIAEKSGDAAIIVAGYPTLFSEDGFTAKLLGFNLDVSPEISAQVNGAVRWLNGEIKSIVRECANEGMNIWYVDVAYSFKGKEAYTEGAFINEISTAESDDDVNYDPNSLVNISSSSMHPNADGAAAYAAAVQAKMNAIDNGEPERVEVSTWTAMKEALEAGDSVKLTADVTAKYYDTAVTIPAGADVTLDLNGHTADRNLKYANDRERDGAFTVNGKFTLDDSSEAKTGKLIKSYNRIGGAVLVKDGGEFVVNGGTITECFASESGGAVAVATTGTFIMTGGTITGCGNTEIGGMGFIGGGVNAACYKDKGRFIILGGTITDNKNNSAKENVYIPADTTLYIKAGKSVENIAGQGTTKNFAEVTVSDSITNGTITASEGTFEVLGKKYYFPGSTITLDVEPDVGYEIGDVVYNDGSDHIIQPIDGVYSFEMPYADVTVSAQFIKQYKATFMNGETEFSSAYVSPKTGKVTPPKPDPSHDYMDFIGWSVNGEKFDFENTPISSDTVFDAIFVDQYKATFMDGEKEFAVTYASTKTGKVTPPNNNPEPYGKQLIYWAVNEKQFDFGKDTISGDTVFNAVYTDIKPVKYLEADGTEKVCENYTSVTANQTSLVGTSRDGWYVVDKDITAKIKTSGEVKLILCDGVTLTGDCQIDGGKVDDKGIITSVSMLTVYGQSTDESTMGVWEVSREINSGFGSLTINGGKISLEGFKDYQRTINVLELTINGGIVNADGGYYELSERQEPFRQHAITSANIKINGGKVTARPNPKVEDNVGISIRVHPYTLYQKEINLTWTNGDDFIDNQGKYRNTTKIVEGKKFFVFGTTDFAYYNSPDDNNIDNAKIVPALKATFINGTTEFDSKYVPGTPGTVTKPADDPTDGDKVFKYWSVDGKEFDFENDTIKKDTVFMAVFENAPQTYEATVVVVWDDDDNSAGIRPEKVTAKIANTEIELNASNEWSATVTGLSEDGLSWTLSGVPEGYTQSELVVQESVTTITLTHESAPTYDYTLQIVWDDANDKDKLRPEKVTAKIADTEKELNASNEWSATVTGLSEDNLEWSIPEIPEGYTQDEPVVQESVTTITLQKTHEATIAVVWDDDDNIRATRPESLKCYIEGKEYELSEANSWTTTATGLVANKDDWVLDGDLDGYEINHETTGTVTTYTLKYVTAPPPVHTHSFTYSASGATVTATCENGGCDLTDNKVTLTIVKPAKSKYNDNGTPNATLTGLEVFNTATELTVSETAIEYYKGGDKLGKAPTDPGTYKAQITVEGETASVDYTIEKADGPKAPTGLTSTNESSEGSKDGTISGVNSVMEYKLSTATEYTAITSDTITGLSAGEYKVRFKETDTQNASSDTTVAVGIGRSVTVIFDADGGSPVPEKQERTTGQKADEPETDPEKEGCTFRFWSADGTTEYDFSAELTGNIMLKAIYEANEYTITFDTKGGTEISPITKKYGEAITAPAAPTKQGYVFGGWDKAIPATMPEYDMTITARWITPSGPSKPTSSGSSGGTSTGSSSSSGDCSSQNRTNVKMWAKLNADNSITAGWDKISAVSKYVLYCEKDGKLVQIAETSKTKITIKNAKNNFTYKFTLKVKQGGVISDAPTGYKISFNCYFKPVVKLTVKDGKITASWKKVAGAEKYRVYKLVNGKLKLVKETSNAAVRFTGVKSGKTYTYAVSACVDGKWTKLVKSDRVSIKVK